MPTKREIVEQHDPDPDENPWVHGAPSPEDIELVPYDPEWRESFRRLSGTIRNALGTRTLHLEHVGSTAVPGLAAKPVIDIDLTVADPSDEDAYVLALSALDYDLTVREPSWHEHRCLRLAEPRVNLHVFGPDCPETIRHVLFRDWLRAHSDDRALYERAKHSAADGARLVSDYNQRKQNVIRAIYDRIFRAEGLL